MSTTLAPSREKISSGKRWTFRVLTVAFIGLLGIYAAESALRWRQGNIAQSDVLAPGMVQYDPDLGWRLTPGWSGRHDHKEFSATYSINALGLRNDAPVQVRIPGNRLTLVVGDSFTFGLGVNDDETFVHHLNGTHPPGISFSNGSIPGFSTDQQALLIGKRLLSLTPDRILLVVYLSNDLFDNRRAFPLQVSSPKPYFAVTEKGLELRNHPVPKQRKPPSSGPDGLVAAVWGEDIAQWPWRTRLEQQSELFRIFSQQLLPQSDYRAVLRTRFTSETDLFQMLMDEIATACQKRGVNLVIVTLAGRSFVTDPGSVSAQYQELFRDQVVSYAKARQIAAIDVAGLMQASFKQQRKDWFYPNDGHLNPAGHKVVAELLQARLSD
jgi:lysophospholipase L1-like esterase